MPDFLGDQEYQDHVETPVALEHLDYKAVLVAKVFVLLFLCFSISLTMLPYLNWNVFIFVLSGFTRTRR